MLRNNFLLLLFLGMFFSACTPSKDSYIKKVTNDFETSGFLTDNIFQVTCSVELQPNDLKLFVGELSKKKSQKLGESFAESNLRSRLLQGCQEEALLVLAQNRLAMEKKSSVAAQEIKHLFQEFLPGVIVFETLKNTQLFAAYRIEKKNLILLVSKIKIK